MRRSAEARRKLHKLNYFQPLSEESLALVDCLLRDLHRSADCSTALWRSVQKREREAEEAEAKLFKLKKEHPQLLRENTELHQQLLSDNAQHEARRLQLEEKMKLAQERLLEAALLRSKELARAVELRSSGERLRALSAELQQQAIAGQRPPRSVSAGPRGSLAQGAALEHERRAGVVHPLAAERVQELLAALGCARKERARLALQLHSQSPLRSARGEAGLEQRLASLEAATAPLRSAARSIEGGLAHAASVAAAQGPSAAPMRYGENLAESLLQREAAVERAALSQAEVSLSRELREVVEESVSKAAAIMEEVQALKEHIAAEQRQRSTERLAQLEAELHSAAKTRTFWHERTAHLVTRLAAAQSHKAIQQQLLATRVEEATAAQQAQEAGSAEASTLEFRLADLQATALTSAGEAEALRECLEAVTAEQHVATSQCVDARSNEVRCRGEADESEEAGQRVAAEVEQTRASSFATEERVTEAYKEGEQLQEQSAELQQSLAFFQEQLQRVQREHRELSSRIGRTLADLEPRRVEGRAELVMEGELQQSVLDAEEALQRMTLGCERLEESWSQEGQRLEEATAALRQATEAMSRRDSKMQQEVFGHLARFEPALHDEIRAELHRLAKVENPRLSEELQDSMVSYSAIGAQEIEVKLQDMTKLLRFREEESAARRVLAVREDAGPPRAHDFVVDLGGFEREHAQLEASLLKEERAAAGVSAALAEASRLFQGEQAAEGAGGAILRDLQLHRSQLQGLMHTLEATSEQLVMSLQMADAEFVEEKTRHKEIEHGALGTRARLEEMETERMRLHRTLEALDADQVELSRIDGVQVDELSTLRAEATQLQAAKATMQRSLYRARHAVDARQGELELEAREAETTSREVSTLEVASEAFSHEASQQRREAALGLDDLLNMTRENQLLHGQLVRVQQEKADRQANALSQQALVLPRLQDLHGTKMECGSAIQAYKLALDLRERNEVAIVEVAGQVSRSRAEVEALQGTLASIEEEYVNAQAAMMRGTTATVAARAELSELTRSLEVQELSKEESAVQRARLHHAMEVQQAGITQACLSSNASVLEVESLRTEIDLLQSSLQAAQASGVQGQNERQEALKRCRQLQELIAQQRCTRQRLESEGAALRSLRSVGAAPSPDAAAGEATLQRTLEQQQTLLAQIGAEEQGLREEVEQLSAQLEQLQGGARSSAAAEA